MRCRIFLCLTRLCYLSKMLSPVSCYHCHHLSCHMSCLVRNDGLLTAVTWSGSYGLVHVSNRWVNVKKNVTPVHQQWSYVFLALSHRNGMVYVAQQTIPGLPSWSHIMQGSFCVCTQPMRGGLHGNVISHWLGPPTEWSMIMWWSLWNSFEDRAPVYRCLIFKWVEVTWPIDRAPEY